MKKIFKWITTAIYCFLGISLLTIILYANNESFKTFLYNKANGVDRKVDINKADKKSGEYKKGSIEEQMYSEVLSFCPEAGWDIQFTGTTEVLYDAMFIVDVGYDQEDKDYFIERAWANGDPELGTFLQCGDFMLRNTNDGSEIRVLVTTDGRMVAMGRKGTRAYLCERIQ